MELKTLVSDKFVLLWVGLVSIICGSYLIFVKARLWNIGLTETQKYIVGGVFIAYGIWAVYMVFPRIVDLLKNK